MNSRLSLLLLALVFFDSPASPAAQPPVPQQLVYILPVRTDIMPPLVYLIRRGVKEAMAAKADLLILDMDTNGGRVDTTEEIIEILGQFKGETLTYVNRKAFSAGAFIAVATKRIYMAPQSVIGAAAPMLLVPGAGPESMPASVEAKMTSGIKALVRTNAKKNGHNPDVIEAMIDRTKELKIGDKVLNKEGQILTLDNEEATTLMGDPPRPLLAAGTAENLDQLLTTIGYEKANRVRIQPTGAERLAQWINLISPVLLIVGAVGLYIEFKTPGFGIPGILGLGAFTLYFLGNYIAGLAGLEWLVLFVLGIGLLVVEFILFPGTILPALTGASLMVLAILMAGVDLYPGMPSIPSSSQLAPPIRDFLIACLGTAVALYIASRLLPQTHWFGALIAATPSGQTSTQKRLQDQTGLLGAQGVAISALVPGGKVQIGTRIIDVITTGEALPPGTRVKVVQHDGFSAVVEPITDRSRS